jgi:uncharacterized membrane protein
MPYQQRRSHRTNREMAATFGVIAAGTALFEAALIPGMVIGGAAVLAPKYLLKLGRRLKPLLNSTVPRRMESAVSLPERPDVKVPLAVPAPLEIKQAVFKTVTYRIIVTTIDFTANYVVIGELAAAAGLSAVSLVAGPIFYFVHETAWNYFGPSVARKFGRLGIAIDHPALPPLRPDTEVPPADREEFTITRALAKTITFRAFATVTDFTTNFVVTGELATAAKLTAIGFVIGPFVYFGHERVWDYYGSPRARAARGAKDNVSGWPKLHGPAATDATSLIQS